MKTITGREIPNPPQIRLDSNRKAINDLKKLDQWLLDQAFDEAKSRNDDYFPLLIKNEKAGKLPVATKESINLYLFGEV